VDGTPVELRVRVQQRWKTPRYEVFLADGKYLSGIVWRAGNKLGSTEGSTFGSRKAALRSLIQLCLYLRPEPTVPTVSRRGRSKKTQIPSDSLQTLVACPACAALVGTHRSAIGIRIPRRSRFAIDGSQAQQTWRLFELDPVSKRTRYCFTPPQQCCTFFHCCRNTVRYVRPWRPFSHRRPEP
jgi:hypothetical protein